MPLAILDVHAHGVIARHGTDDHAEVLCARLK
jgi:hypothetical protein